ncbi:MAG: hypothetical protein A3C43_03920 [Candidatus Schekmanbacteria bacterium RIFCSPHIGHO2_02_FULL_38_11]|uniref:Molecular chaperone Skp n=1 Tax=Candidatus Schekmanbacteria bacterium RIFCSPLOWO2_12_FULL_38_15 TaxID=1817883 RepID=A0A1F7SH54_9BACT|nr:MAG: hypothetical protein A2043_04470 [Candidatus Schekmanbacteria bacterium GWA2_38_9]OGL49707.1 MAG: hypothetical protein A3H37_01610 [Candidatus Schekmanbacteria bacterium RIFCSPLOWO2_02_FULL_38_14]OGL53061.1 MAG: hypothetical protein A3G31_09165 [Candidatus Schekmanbacteria bacterium RIFCSPLOWO2_12_FULL_38_15]OGL53765.1 MAG: hypothetical protein A3C43_03920 [Candidatus Schekmanbacteria bacterium RIFCSPHIGHO2_02_FULL_38_11]
MKIFFSVISLMLFSLYASSSYGENFKIGVVDIQKIMLESKKGKQSLKELKEEFEEKRKKIESADKELEMLKKEILDKVSIWSNETKEKKEEDFNQKLKKYQRDREEFEEEMGEKNSQVNQRILSEIINIVEDVAKSENYTIILEKETLIYLSPSVDITGRVVEKYDRM